MAAPKLLDKKIVNATIATEQKQQIDAGMRLARKVDAVRETLQQEEQHLDTFRTNTIARVQIEINEYIQKKELAKKELERLERDIQFLQTRKSVELLELPPDEQWQRVEALFTKYDGDVKNLEAARESVAQHIRDNAVITERLQIEQGRLDDVKRLSSEELAHADTMLSDAKEEVAKIRNKAQVILLAAELREREVILKEEDIESREAAISAEKMRFAELEIDIANRERILKDRYATLERTLKRINNQ